MKHTINSAQKFRCGVVVLLAVLILGGCATTTGRSAELTITKECDEYRCTYMATMINTGYRLLLSPRVELLAFDCDGNTIDSHAIYYDEILGGKKQTKRLRFRDEPMKFFVKVADWPVPKGQTFTFC